MGDLTGQTVASTYSQLLNVASLDATYRSVTAGNGTATGLSVSTSGIRAADLNATGAVTFNSTLGVTGLITATGGVSGAVTGNVTGNVIGNITGNLTGVVTGNVTGNVTGSADTLTTGRTIAATGDIAWTSPAFDGSGNVTAAATISDLSISTGKIADDAVTADKLADTIVSAGSYTHSSITVDAQGRLTSASNGTSVTPDSEISSYTANATWTKPTNVKVIQVTVFGAGGGGGGSAGGAGTGEGGNGGSVSDWIDVTSVTSVAVTTGTGGTGATGGTNNGTDGTSSSFGSYLTGAGGTGGTQGTATKAANGAVTGSQPSAISLDSMLVNSTYGTGGGKGVNGSTGAVIVRVIG